MSLWTAIRDVVLPPFRTYTLCEIGPDCDVSVEVVSKGGYAHLKVADRGLSHDGHWYADSALYYARQLLPALASEGYRFPESLPTQLERSAIR